MDYQFILGYTMNINSWIQHVSSNNQESFVQYNENRRFQWICSHVRHMKRTKLNTNMNYNLAHNGSFLYKKTRIESDMLQTSERKLWNSMFW